MRMTSDGGQLVLTDNPWPERLFAAFFAGVGGLFVLLPLADPGAVDPLVAVGAKLMGLAAIGAGFYLLANGQRSTVTVSPAARRIVVEQRLGWRRTCRDIAFAAVAEVALDETKDTDGDPCWRPALILATGETVPLSRLYRHDRAALEAVCASLRRVLAARPG